LSGQLDTPVTMAFILNKFSEVNMHIMKFDYRHGLKFLFLIMIFGLVGCSSSDVINTKLQVNAATYLNPNSNGKASPVMVNFYNLTSPVAFKQAGYFQLQNNAGSTLGDNLIDKQNVAMRPGDSITRTLKVPSSVKYLGFTVGYRNIDQAKWRALVQIPKKTSHWYSMAGRSLRVELNLHSQGLEAHLVK